MNNFVCAMFGAICGWLSVGFLFLLYRYFKNSPPRIKRKNICLLIGNPGSGAKKFLNSQKELQRNYSEVVFYERLAEADLDINGLLSLETPIDTFLIYGWLSNPGDAGRWEDFLKRIPIKHDYHHPFYRYVPDVHHYESDTIIKLSKKDDYWLLQKLQAKDHKVIY